MSKNHTPNSAPSNTLSLNRGQAAGAASTPTTPVETTVDAAAVEAAAKAAEAEAAAKAAEAEAAAKAAAKAAEELAAPKPLRKALISLNQAAYPDTLMTPMTHLFTSQVVTHEPKLIEVDEFTQAQLDAGKWCETVL